MVRGKLLIAQGGGPTAVINQSLVGAVLAARKQSNITGILGARHGIAGILKEDFIDLTTQSVEQLELVATTPAAALGSVRLKPGKAECEKVFEVFKKNAGAGGSKRVSRTLGRGVSAVPRVFETEPGRERSSI